MPYSVPFASGRPLPLNILENIAFHLVSAPPAHPSIPSDAHPYLYGPPAHLPPCLPVGMSRLPALLSVSTSVYQALSPGVASSKANGERYPLQTELYARLYCTFFDVKAVGRRWRSRTTQRLPSPDDDKDGWDRDVRGVTNAGLTAQLVLVCKLLKFYRNGAKEMGVPLPPQAEEDLRKPRRKPKRNPLASLYDPELEKMLLLTFMMMTEDDGLNHHQLRLVSAPLFIDMLVFHRLNESTGEGVSGASGGANSQVEVRYNDGWPVENVMNTVAVWLLWMFTTQEKIVSESLPIRERIVKLVLPFVFVPYRYASALVPPTHFTLPLTGSFGGEAPEDVFQKPLSTSTAHGSFPVYHSYPFTPLAATVNNTTQSAAPVEEQADLGTRDPTRFVTQPVQEDASRQGEPPPPPPRPEPGNAHAGSSTGPAMLPSLGEPSNPQPPPPPAIVTIPQRPPPTHSNSQMHPSFGVAVPWYHSPYDTTTRPGTSTTGDGNGVHQHLDGDTHLIVIHLPLITAAAKLVFMSRREAVPLPVIPDLPVDREAATRSGWRWVGPTQADMREMGGWCTWGRRRVLAPPPPSTNGSTSATAGAVAGASAGGSASGTETVSGGGPAPNLDAAPSRNRNSGLTDEGLPWHTDSRRWDTDWWRMVLCGGLEWQQRQTTHPPQKDVLYKQPKMSLASRMGRVYEKGVLTGLWQGYMHMPSEPSLRYVATTRQYPLNFSEGALGVTMRPVLMRLAEHVWVPTPLDPGRFGEARKFSSARRTAGTHRSSEVGRKGRLGKESAETKMYWEEDLSIRKGEEGEGVFDYVPPQGPGPVPVAKPTMMTKFVIEHVDVEEDEDTDEASSDGGGGSNGYSVSDDGSSSQIEEEYEYEGEEEEERSDEGSVQTQSSNEDPKEYYKRLVRVPVARSRTGFLDENMNNAWLPGAPGTLEWEDGTRLTTTTTSVHAPFITTTSAGDIVSSTHGAGNGNAVDAPAERGVDEGVWRDRFDGGRGEGGVQRMRSVTIVVPVRLSSSTFHYSGGEGVGDDGDGGAAAAGNVNAAAATATNATATTANTNPIDPQTQSTSVLMTTRVDNPNAALSLPQPGEAPNADANAARPPPVVVPGSRHVYETYDPSGEREGVHERMERARGMEVCRGVRRRRQMGAMSREGSRDGNGKEREGMRKQDAQFEQYAYPHPGCLKCREREGILERRKGKEKWAPPPMGERYGDEEGREKNLDIEALFAGVGLGRSNPASGGGGHHHSGKVDDDLQSDAGEDEDENIVEEIEFGADGEGDRGGDSPSEEEDDSEEIGSELEGWCDDCHGEDPARGACGHSCSDGLEDVVITGGMDERHAQAWGGFKYYGRVRPWDGLIGVLRMGMQPGNVGGQFFYGYVYGGRTFVGNWRFAAADAVSPTMESSFVVSKRGE